MINLISDIRIPGYRIPDTGIPGIPGYISAFCDGDSFSENLILKSVVMAGFKDNLFYESKVRKILMDTFSNLLLLL
jgi:hypothetical protein